MPVDIDEKDRQIIDILRDHANFSTRKIAKKTLLPVTTVHNRIKKLDKLSVIKKYTVALDYALLGKPLLSYIQIFVNVPVLQQKKITQLDVVKKLQQYEDIEYAAVITGGADILVRTRVSSISDLDDLIRNKIQSISGIEKTQTMMVINEG